MTNKESVKLQVKQDQECVASGARKTRKSVMVQSKHVQKINKLDLGQPNDGVYVPLLSS